MTTPTRKANIPKALREQVWLRRMGKTYLGKCPTKWCENQITVFDFHCGHNIPESRGGATTVDNLIPICGRCNLSMSDTYTFDEWHKKFAPPIVKSTGCFSWCVNSSVQNRNGQTTDTQTAATATATGGRK